MENSQETRYPNKLLYGFIALCAVLFSVLMFLSYKADASLATNDTGLAVASYKYYSGLLKLINLIGFLALLTYANIYFIRLKLGGLLFIVTFIFAALFINLYYAYLSESFFHYRKEHGLWGGEFSLAPFKGLIVSALVLALVTANYMVINMIVKEREKKKKVASKQTAVQPDLPQNDPS
jgi:hypothetical protein